MKSPSWPVGRSVWLFAAALTIATPVSAQDRVFIGKHEVGAFGRFGQKIGDAPAWLPGELVGGGRYSVVLVDALARRYQVLDTRTGAALTVPAGRIVAVDPAHPRIFILDGEQVSAVQLPVMAATPLVTASCHSPTSFGCSPPEFSYATGTGELFVRRRAAVGTGPELVVVNATTGAILRTLPDLDTLRFLTADVLGRPSVWSASADGRRLFADWTAGFTMPPTVGYWLRSHDAMSGALLGQARVQGTGWVQDDPVFRRALHWEPSELQGYDGSARFLGSLPTGFCVPALKVSPHTGRIYILRAAGGGGSYYGAIDTRLTVLDGATGAVLADRSVTQELGLGVDRPVCGEYLLSLLTAPAPPRDLRAQVTGSTVTIAWQDISNASSFVLDAGYLPGQTPCRSTSVPARQPRSATSRPARTTCA